MYFANYKSSFFNNQLFFTNFAKGGGSTTRRASQHASINPFSFTPNPVGVRGLLPLVSRRGYRGLHKVLGVSRCSSLVFAGTSVQGCSVGKVASKTPRLYVHTAASAGAGAVSLFSKNNNRNFSDINSLQVTSGLYSGEGYTKTIKTKDNYFFESNRTNIICCASNNISNFNSNKQQDNKQEVVSITYEEIGLFPRSFSRVLDRFLKQVFSDVENLVIQEYRFYRYLFLTTLKCLLILFFIPFLVNFVAKTYIVRPLTEYFWNTKQTEIFLNSSQQKHAFAELKEFEEKTYFESLIFPKSIFTYNNVDSSLQLPIGENKNSLVFMDSQQTKKNEVTSKIDSTLQQINNYQTIKSLNLDGSPLNNENTNTQLTKRNADSSATENITSTLLPPSLRELERGKGTREKLNNKILMKASSIENSITTNDLNKAVTSRYEFPLTYSEGVRHGNGFIDEVGTREQKALRTTNEDQRAWEQNYEQKHDGESQNGLSKRSEEQGQNLKKQEHSPYGVTALFIYETQEADKNLQQRYQEKTIELAQRYNDQSVEAITNIFADLISLLTLFYLLYALEIQINITKSFLLEVFFGLDDSKKSLLILLVTDLLVGYHSSNLWELFFEFLFHHYGLPESQTGVFLLVATLPVLLDVLFKYLIFRHLNRSSPATVATYHAMIE